MSLESNVLRILQVFAPVLENVRQCRSIASNKGPLILGLTGLQGSGKSTWATTIVNLLRDHFGLKAIQVSLDDFYRTHQELVHIRDQNAENRLLRTRGQPGTHDEVLASSFFEQLRHREAGLKIPVFEKSLHNGEGDRTPRDQWPEVPPDIDVVVFEGWCVGFRPLTLSEVTHKREQASQLMDQQLSTQRRTNTLGDHPIEHLNILNDNLERYCDAFMGPQHFDAFIHLDTDKLSNVYTWRIEQEHALIKTRGSGMTDEEVIAFIRGYMPAYELYLQRLRQDRFPKSSSYDDSNVHVRVCLGPRREVLDVTRV